MGISELLAMGSHPFTHLLEQNLQIQLHGCNPTNELQSAKQRCSYDSGLMWLFYTHFQTGHQLQKLSVKQVEAVPQLIGYNGR